ncbi:selenium metabolism-associated LysR family transcriptional regulator [Gorillibacterium massiliense]|uniref:selenium metabolism-associated LysR family transcriptional regulator n=1 Tax=Gorillibacterium massiliense TaxID=1280390 RepID=UPI0004B7CA51|nr:selenium metabolism-associated LysR family transcriptional regulator [Gorillibacterium massiliense]
MALNFHQLHIFYTVAEKGSFSAAAHALYMSQPAVTMQIQALEEHFGAKVFQRTTKRIELTDAGRALLPYARRSVELMLDTEREMSRYTHMLKGKLELGASLTVGEYMLPRLLGPFNQEFPDISISMRVMNTKQIVEEVLAHSLIFGLVEAPVDHPDIAAEPVHEDELLLVLPKDHRLLAKEKLVPADLLPYPFILREPGSGTRKVVEEVWKRSESGSKALNIAMELGSTGAIKSAVEAGLGLSVLSSSSVRHETALGVLHTRRIEGMSFTRSFYSVYLKSTLLPLPAVTFLTFIREKDLSRLL